MSRRQPIPQKPRQPAAVSTVQRAFALHQQGKLAEAGTLYDAVLAQKPDHFDALHWSGLLRQQQGQTAEAFRLVDAALKLEPANPAALCSFGLLNAAMGRPEVALQSYDKALTIKPDYPEALNNRGNALRQLRRPHEALESYDRALAQKPNFAEALINRGNSLRDLGALQNALESFDRAIALAPHFAEAHNNRGAVLRDLGRPQEALASYEKALARKPNYAEALANHGYILACLGRPEEALTSLDRALAIKPDLSEALCNRGSVLKDLARLREALRDFDKALALRPNFAQALNNRGTVLQALERTADSLASYEAALELRPDYADALSNRGNALRDLRRFEEALACYDKALALVPDFPEAVSNRANVLTDLNRVDEALAAYDKALAMKPDYAEAYNNKAVLLTELGRFEDASNALEVAIGLAPRRVRSYYSLTECKRLRSDDPHFGAMQELAREMPLLTTKEQIDLHFALGKAYADVDDHARSFSHLLDGNSLKRGQIAYSESAVMAAFERTRSIFTSAMMEGSAGAGDISNVPVFVLGMPRSGTTLIEQILASHSKVFGAGEIDDFARALEGVGREGRGDVGFPEIASTLSRDDLRRVGASYVDRIARAAPTAERISNKMPDNFRFVGLIHMALPNARILHVRRDPVDTCLSCFSKRFVQSLPYTYDLAELGRYYRAYEVVMAHWHSVLPPGVMLDVQYEDVVADLEGQARRILSHCGLDWEARCLDFHKTERSVRTASAMQVRQPVYKSSVERWRPYEPFLGPLLRELSHKGGAV